MTIMRKVDRGWGMPRNTNASTGRISEKEPAGRR